MQGVEEKMAELPFVKGGHRRDKSGGFTGNGMEQEVHEKSRSGRLQERQRGQSEERDHQKLWIRYIRY